jgi:hypothetical protein
MVGRFLGIGSHTIELKNIVAGDLPFDFANGDFYLSVECAANPPMVTSLAEDNSPKVVHWPEVVTLKLRASSMEQRVRIAVKELNVVGSVELCELYLSATDIIDWSDDGPSDVIQDPNSKMWQRANNDSDIATVAASNSQAHFRTKIRRFAMKVLDHEIERETPPWISLCFEQPTEARRLETLGRGNPFDLIGTTTTVRTWEDASPLLNDGTVTMQSDREKQMYHGGYSTARMHVEEDGGVLSTMTYREDRMADFKNQHPLLDDKGNRVQEPDEHLLWWFHAIRVAVVYLFRFIDVLIVASIFIFVGIRLYIYSCYTQYRVYTMALRQNVTFPISRAVYQDVKKLCQQKMVGTGIAPGANDDGCRPSHAMVEMTCDNPPGPNGGQRPEAGTQKIYEWFGIEISNGIPCYERLPFIPNFMPSDPADTQAKGNDLCWFRHQMVSVYDPPFPGLEATVPWIGRNSTGLLFLVVIVRWVLHIFADRAIRSMRRRHQKEEAEKLQHAMNHHKKNSYSSWGPKTAQERTNATNQATSSQR